MKIKFSYVIIAAAVVLVVYVGALVTESYGGRTWIDAPLHFLGGIFLGVLWLWGVSRRFMRKFLGSLSKPLVSISVVGFVALGGLLWEAFEALLREFLPYYASVLGFNSLINDMASDLMFGFFGGVVVVGVYLGVSKLRFNK